MKGVRFKNSASLIHSILDSTPSTHPHDASLDLEFSTFRSEDYRYQDYLPHQMTSPLQENSNYYLEDLTNSFMSEDSEAIEEEKQPQSCVLPSKISTKKMNFCNRKTLIDRILNVKVQKGIRRLNFTNQSKQLRRVLPLESKLSD